VSLCLCGESVCGEESSDLKVESSGLRVVAPIRNSDELLHAFSARTAGTTVTLLVESGAGGFIKLDQAASSVSKFTDDKGNDLFARKSADEPVGASTLTFTPVISRDGKACSLEVSAPNAPAKGAVALKLSGTITMVCATAKTEFVQKDVLLKNGSKITAPDLNLTVEKVGKPDVGDEPLSLTLRATKTLDSIAEIKFFKADGKEIKSRSAGIAKMGVLGSLIVEWTFNLAEPADAVTAKIYFWTDLKKKKVDFDLNIQAGL
jgi:hypothetical protein